MNDSRVIVLVFRAVRAVQGRVLGLAYNFLDCFRRDDRTKRGGEASNLTLKEFYLPKHFSH